MPRTIKGVMDEFKQGRLHSGSSQGKTVTNPTQALAIGMSEQRQLAKSRHPHGNLGAYLHKPKGK